MIIIEPGHSYELKRLDGCGHDRLIFVSRQEGSEHTGTNNQEVIRALINRIKFLDNELHWHGNDKIIYHLRMSLALHEERHIEVLCERGETEIENIKIGNDGHWEIK